MHASVPAPELCAEGELTCRESRACMRNRGFYHVILRGNGKQLLFENDDDRLHFLKLLRGKTQKRRCVRTRLVSYEQPYPPVAERPARQLELRHARFGNRILALLQQCVGTHRGRYFKVGSPAFPSKATASCSKALRYIHDNPEKAGVAPAREYRWSSYGEYLVGAQLVDDGVVLDLIGGRSQFPTFCNDGRYAALLCARREACRRRGRHGAGARSLAGASPAELTSLPKERRDDALRALRRAGLMVKQIERLTGIGGEHHLPRGGSTQTVDRRRSRRGVELLGRGDG